MHGAVVSDMLTSVESVSHTDNLSAFISELPRGGVSAFAGRLKVSRVYLSQLACRQRGREPSPELCVLIERESGRKVRRWALRPSDWHRIWPELIGADGAPPVPQGDEARDVA